jgi:septation ring formation regulator EzrA
VLVLALAASLTAIWILLRRIGSTLHEIHTTLARVEEGSRSLERELDPLVNPCEACEHDLEQAASRLDHADRYLEASAERLGIGTGSRAR